MALNSTLSVLREVAYKQLQSSSIKEEKNTPWILKVILDIQRIMYVYTGVHVYLSYPTHTHVYLLSDFGLMY